LWKAKPSNRFRRSYNKLDSEMVERVEGALQSLLNADRPERLGIQKTGRRKGYWAFELGRSCRIIYRPEYDEGLIEFFRLCSHTEVYEP
jgi:mRNA-degrading endonuclease RelE of RelBE toxin-antitoxin system